LEALDKYLQDLLSLAQQTCALVDQWRPDIILPCYRGARLPQLAAQGAGGAPGPIAPRLTR
jgi:hypothetical protein